MGTVIVGSRRKMGGGCRNDMAVEIAQMAKGHIVASGTYHVGHDNGDDVPDLHEAGDWNESHPDRLFVESYYAVNENDEMDDGEVSDDDRYYHSQFMQQSIDEDSEKEAFLAREKQLISLHYEAVNHPFYAYERHFGASVDKRTVRSEALAVVQSRSATRGDILSRKPVFFDGVRIS